MQQQGILIKINKMKYYLTSPKVYHRKLEINNFLVDTSGWPYHWKLATQYMLDYAQCSN